MKIVAIIGAGQNSGKTTTVEVLVKAFKEKGLRVGTIKQIHKKNFSLDKPGKDTWRHSQAGAEIVVSASPDEVALLKKIEKNPCSETFLNSPPEDIRFKEAYALLKNQELDWLIVEGNPGVNIPMIYAARETPLDASKPVLPNVFCFVSLTPENFQQNRLPLFHLSKEIPQFVDFVLEKFKKVKHFSEEIS